MKNYAKDSVHLDNHLVLKELLLGYLNSQWIMDMLIMETVKTKLSLYKMWSHNSSFTGVNEEVLLVEFISSAMQGYCSSAQWNGKNGNVMSLFRPQLSHI